MSEKSKSEQLKEGLFYKRKNGRLISSEETLKNADEYCEGYKSFLNAAKTEREAVNTAVALAKEKGFTEFVYGKKAVEIGLIVIIIYADDNAVKRLFDKLPLF